MLAAIELASLHLHVVSRAVMKVAGTCIQTNVLTSDADAIMAMPGLRCIANVYVHMAGGIFRAQLTQCKNSSQTGQQFTNLQHIRSMCAQHR